VLPGKWRIENGDAMEHTFKLTFELIDKNIDMDILMERLGAAGCNDALVGVGHPGRITLEFTRQAQDMLAARVSAIADVTMAIPIAKLT